MADRQLPLHEAMPSASARANAVHAQLQQLVRAYVPRLSAGQSETAGLENCLPPLLAALGWPGHTRNLVEVLPHLEIVKDIEGLRAVLVRLNFATEAVALDRDRVHGLELPCLFRSAENEVQVILARTPDGLKVFDSRSGATTTIPSLPDSGTAYVLRPLESAGQRGARDSWAWSLLHRFRGTVVKIAFISLLINLLALLPSLFILAVYDTAIATRSYGLLANLVAGIGIVVAAEYFLRRARGRTLAYLGARWDVMTGSRALETVLNLPLAFTESGPVSSQITRLRQFENLRDMFSGQMAIALLDAPFIAIYVAAIGAIGGHLVWAPLLLVTAFAILALVTIPVMRRRYSATGESRQKLLRLLMETITKHRAIKESGAEQAWRERVESAAQAAAQHHRRSEEMSHYVSNATQFLTGIAGIGTLYAGLHMVLAGGLSVGALIAAMAVVWRFVSPVQAAFLHLNRFQQVSNAVRQANQLFRLKPEREPGRLSPLFRSFRGNLTINRVSFRYSATADPALNGVSVQIPSGQLVALAGPGGAGKSTLLRLIARLYAAQGGSILYDGVDIRQLDAGELRHSLAYVPDCFDFFHGTIAQNLRLAAPLATDEELATALAEARVEDFAGTLPDGLDTWLKADVAARLPPGFRQRIILARAWIKNVPLYLLDEPANNLDRLGEEALLRKLEALRGKATVIMATQRPSHMSIADRVIYMQEGAVLFDGKPDKIVPLIVKAA